MSTFIDRNQNFWHLTSIQGASFGLPTLFLASGLTKTYGAGTTLLSLSIAFLPASTGVTNSHATDDE